MSKLDKKVDQAIRLLRAIPTDSGPIEVSYSGGKDSDVILELVRMAGIPYEAIYKNTTILRRRNFLIELLGATAQKRNRR